MFDNITVMYFHQFYIGAISMLENGLEENNRIIAENSAKIYEAQNHATALETQVCPETLWTAEILNKS